MLKVLCWHKSNISKHWYFIHTISDKNLITSFEIKVGNIYSLQEKICQIGGKLVFT